MRIDQLTVLNFRRFEENTFELHPRFTLLVGDNGAGKTALLEALRVGVGAYLLGIDNSPVPAPSIRRDCVRLETRQGGEFSTFERVIPCVVRCEGRVHGQDLRWSRKLTSVRGRTNRVGTRALEQCVKRHAQEDKKAMKDEQVVNLPLVAFYGTGRLWIEPRTTKRVRSAVRQPLGKASRFEAYRGCLEPTVSSEWLRRWIKKMELIAHQNQQPLQSLDAVYGAVVGCVEGVEKAEYDFDMDDIVLDFKNGERFPFDLLSDGQRTMMALAADVAWRCVQLNPHLAGQALRETEGVVLIDELDLHLHPNWQGVIVRNLLSFFSKLQFVATTHSPFIVQSLDGQGLINLSDDNFLQERKEPYSIEDVAEETMGVKAPQRSKRFLEMETAARRYYELLDQCKDDQHPDVEQAKKELDRIEADFSDNPAYAAFLKLDHYAAG
ncbi:AAA family ATPase [Candidatus Synechococcus spongiarum]|uniref:Uncharacterized protein n=1 Tax=Candidatus Synechococcus spongiarum TaxID=431041 RepID=A0A165B2X7_9SYNE|nr:AAA family ATPase [Candidatus Synechococcus spongiarum]SAY39099.1 hypothetical protein FLM9_1144 [Candidatus Synechococcus spongiarum]